MDFIKEIYDGGINILNVTNKYFAKHLKTFSVPHKNYVIFALKLKRQAAIGRNAIETCNNRSVLNSSNAVH